MEDRKSDESQAKDLSFYFEQGIKDDAERAGIDTRGLVGMAIVHTMVDEIERLLAEGGRKDAVVEAANIWRRVQTPKTELALFDALDSVSGSQEVKFIKPTPEMEVEIQEHLSAADDSSLTPPVITPVMARMLIEARDAHIEGDWNEVFHQIRIFAHETTDDIYNSWGAIEALATADQSQKS